MKKLLSIILLLIGSATTWSVDNFSTKVTNNSEVFLSFYSSSAECFTQNIVCDLLDDIFEREDISSLTSQSEDGHIIVPIGKALSGQNLEIVPYKKVFSNTSSDSYSVIHSISGDAHLNELLTMINKKRNLNIVIKTKNVDMKELMWKEQKVSFSNLAGEPISVQDLSKKFKRKMKREGYILVDKSENDNGLHITIWREGLRKPMIGPGNITLLPFYWNPINGDFESVTSRTFTFEVKDNNLNSMLFSQQIKAEVSCSYCYRKPNNKKVITSILNEIKAQSLKAN